MITNFRKIHTHVLITCLRTLNVILRTFDNVRRHVSKLHVYVLLDVTQRTSLMYVYVLSTKYVDMHLKTYLRAL